MAKKKMKWIEWVAFVLLIVGGLNWGLVGLFDLNLVTLLFGESIMTKIVYGLVGASAVYGAFITKKLI
jgi:uncharacterized protein